ncbi:pimeloyl-ACP methyl ester esterase BioH [Crenothrix sp.]|uniref:pimeloyl-ACP methyl ester esterase BioH n=1 Tax=Crenothrix sp. TaxID=3100433 RepID=UPI00374CD56F
MTKIYQRTVGSGKSIVLVHGWAMHSGVWGDFAAQLAQHYRVTCVDLPGHGYSEPCDEFTLAHISELLVNAVDAETSCWLGWSLGATVVLDLAARFPERVNSVILLAGNPKFVQADPESNDDWPGMNVNAFDAFASHLSQDRLATLSQFLSLQSQGLSGAKNQLSQLKELLSTCALPSQDTLQSGLALLKHSDMRSVLATLDIPVLALLAEKDALVPVAVGQYLHDNYPQVQVNVFKNAGHLLFLSHQQDVLARVYRFMDEQ